MRSDTKLIHILRITLLVCSVSVLLDVRAESKNGFILDGALVPPRDIHSGGPPRDGIPSLDNPKFVSSDRATFLKNKDRVLGVTHNRVSRAYPIRILNYHEIVNDQLGGQAIVVSYCPLCGSGMAFIAEVGGLPTPFGVSGLLYNSDVLMYDRRTNSLWSQLMSQAISGERKGDKLESLSISHTSWIDWRARHPSTEVLTTETGYRRNYRVNPYPNYSANGHLLFPVSQTSSLYRRKEVVMGIEVDGKFKAYPFKELKRAPAQFEDEYEGLKYTVLFDRKNKTARIDDAVGKELPTVMAFWFAWYAFHPDTAVYVAN